MAHFAYQHPAGSSLRQGDLILKKDSIKGVLALAHRYYVEKGDYTHFLVISQSCDLARRDSKPCRARYISLAAVRPLQLVIMREIAKHQKTPAEKVGKLCAKQRRTLVKQFLERLLNNNESEYFYLHEDHELGLPAPSCAFLRLSIAVKAEPHYDALLNARALSLNDTFAAKLGWLVGNMYSRVGTREWVPDPMPRESFDSWIGKLLDEATMWVDDKQLKEARKTLQPDVLRGGMDAVRSHVSETVVKPRKEILLERVAKIAENIGIGREKANNLRSHLDNDPTFTARAQ